jgi:hypothetical protein
MHQIVGNILRPLLHGETVIAQTAPEDSSGDLYPVALAIINGNENEEGWKWFLQSLRSYLDISVVDHPKPTVRYKYFTFISDRRKGLVQALRGVFPLNHSCYCSIHIAKNTGRLVGSRVAKHVHSLSQTFSHNMLLNCLPGSRKFLEKASNIRNQFHQSSGEAQPGLMMKLYHQGME